MNLESLANELLLDLFEFFDAHNLIQAFHGLNTRFDRLLFIQQKRHYLDFRSISKCDFQHFCHQHLPYILDRVVSLHISSDAETPKLPELFLSYRYGINQFINLKSLSIDCISSFDVLNKFICRCHELSQLTHLRVTIQNNQDPEENFHDFINSTWSLSKLTHCYLDIQYPYAAWLLEMSTISKSIRFLSTKNTSYNTYGLSHLFKHTPNLQRLEIGNIGHLSNQYVSTIFPSLISLTVIVQNTSEWMRNLFQHIPNLYYLKVDMHNMNLDGYAWEQTLTNYFHYLKIFHLKMIVEFNSLEIIEEQVEELMNSFRSDYWIEKHRWFVRCDWDPMNMNKSGLLYTLPYAFDKFCYTDGNRSISTSPDNYHYSFNNSAEILQYTQHKVDLCKNQIIYPVRFVNIRHLTIKLPFYGNFLCLISTLNRLASLDVTLKNDLGYPQLQTILDQAPNLYSLYFSHLNKFSMKSFNIISTSIRRLELFQNSYLPLRYFNDTDCSILVNSLLASHCETLIINLEDRKSILQLIDQMPSLRALSVCCKDNQNNRYESININDDLIEWLQTNLPSTYTYSINRDIYYNCRISIWISKAS